MNFKIVVPFFIDLSIAFIDLFNRREFAHLDHQYIFIVRAVKHGDLAFGRTNIVDTPQIIMGQLDFTGGFETGHM